MYHCLTMHIYQPPSDIFELSGYIISDKCCHRGRNPTRSNRFASLCDLRNSLMFPFTIHSDTITNWESPIVTPISGNTFGWRRAFHVTTSLQNFYTGQHELANALGTKLQEPTVVILAGSFVE